MPDYYDADGKKIFTTKVGGLETSGVGFGGSSTWPGWWVPFRILCVGWPLALVGASALLMWTGEDLDWPVSGVFRFWLGVTTAMLIASVIPAMKFWSKRPKWAIRTRDYVAAAFFSLPAIGFLAALAFETPWVLVGGFGLAFVCFIAVGTAPD